MAPDNLMDASSVSSKTGARNFPDMIFTTLAGASLRRPLPCWVDALKYRA